ncbi:MAG: AcrB/AcrD/AcrF family protein, partial [Xanthomonadales bacterium]|nr:AcrB/AcrD/AcrF family protein [Xanthomonadales bacterium]
MYSLSRAGLSIIRVDIKEVYWADRLPQVWNVMRNKLRDLEPSLPARALAPDIMDDFSFVYGFVLAVTGDGYSYAELEDYVYYLKKDLSLVDGVARVELWGVQPKVIYLDVSEAQIAALGLTMEDVLLTLASQNAVVPAGHVQVPGRRLRLEVTGEFESPEDIGKLQIRRSLGDIVRNFVQSEAEDDAPIDSTTELVRIEDIATVRTGYLEPSITQMRFNGQEALAVSLANVAGGNVVKTGQAIDRRLDELVAELPAGINVTRFAWQSDEVKASIDAFIINLAEAVLIVLVVIAIAMGWRMAVVIGSALILTILATFIAMDSMGIELHRVSLGALVVALGMMVDNSIVVADGMAVRLGKGMDAKKAAIESASVPAWPLLGATLVAVMTFYPVYSASTGAGEYAQTLFLVVGISLMVSWVLSVTVTPLQCITMIKPPEGGGQDQNPYGGKWFSAFKSVLEWCLHKRALTLLGLIVVLAIALANIGRVPQQFFPDSTRSQFVIDYWAPEGTPLSTVSKDLKVIENKLAQEERIKNFGTFMGAGGPRFYLPVDPEFPYASYAQIIINTPSFAEVDPLVAELEPWLNDNVPQALTRVRKYTVGPGDTWQFEARLTGPAEADLATLRNLGEEGMAILRQSPYAKQVRTDMRQRVQKVVLDFKQEESRWTGVSRDNVAQSTSRAYDGLPVGVYRDGDDLLPIIARDAQEDRARSAAGLDVITVLPTLGVQSIPLSQIVGDITLQWEDPIIARWNRRRQVAIQASPAGTTYPALRSDVIEEFEGMELPTGYTMEWDGEYKSTRDAQLSLIPGMAPTLAVILIIIVALFNSLRPPLIMFLTIPFAVIGIIAVLAITQTPFGFMALLGAMSLVGMMIKNAIVLLDEVNLNIDTGMSPYDATVMAAVSRLRPVVLAALTTVLGVMPLLQDAFWTSMAMTIMAVLTLGTILTMVVVPLFYVIIYRVPSPEK